MGCSLRCSPFFVMLNKWGQNAVTPIYTHTPKSSKTTAIEKGKEVYLEIFANRKMGKAYFSLTTKEGVNQYLEHRKKDVESGLIVKGRYTTIKTHLQPFLDFIGKDTKLKELERIDCEDYFYERFGNIQKLL
jgi:hypothetical protein